MNDQTLLSIDSLIATIQEELDDLDTSALTPDTVFQEIEGWSSLHSLMLMALIATEYNVELKAEQVREIRSVHDAYAKILANS